MIPSASCGFTFARSRSDDIFATQPASIVEERSGCCRVAPHACAMNALYSVANVLIECGPISRSGSASPSERSAADFTTWPANVL